MQFLSSFCLDTWKADVIYCAISYWKKTFHVGCRCGKAALFLRLFKQQQSCRQFPLLCICPAAATLCLFWSIGAQKWDRIQGKKHARFDLFVLIWVCLSQPLTVIISQHRKSHKIIFCWGMTGQREKIWTFAHQSEKLHHPFQSVLINCKLQN